MTATTWTQFDSKQMSVVFDYAFKHLASGTETAFDLNQCMHQISLPDTLDGQFAEFLGSALGNNSEANFKPTAAVIASSLVRNSLRNNRTDLLFPSVVYDAKLRDVCRRAIGRLLKQSMTCEYVDHSSGGKCVNTKEGHAKGHQDASGQLLADGAFVESDLSPEAFLTSVEKAVESYLQDINENTEPSREARLRYAADLHRQALKKVGQEPR
ncbi:hypothetical protein ACO1O0_009381 [Amphichorda felina]